MTSETFAGLLGLVAIGMVGAYHDLRFRRLPNWLCLVALVSGFGFGFAHHGAGWAGLGLLHALIALLGGMVLFAFRAIGGGDVKFYAGLAAWFPLSSGAMLLAATAFFGLVLGMVWLAVRRKPSPDPDGLEMASDFAKLPYGVAIAAGSVATYLRAAI